MNRRLDMKNRIRTSLAGRRIRPADFLFLVAWVLFISTILCSTTIWYYQNESGGISRIFQYIRYGTYGVCLILICFKFCKKSIIASFGILLAGFGLSMLDSTNKTLFLYAFFLAAAYGIGSDKIIRTTFIVQFLVLALTILFSQTGIIEDYIFDPHNRARHALGFSWATHAAILYFYCSLLYILIRQKRMTLFEFGAMEVINFLLYRATDARMSFYLLTLALVFFLILKFWNFRPLSHQGWKKIFCLLPFIIALLAILLHALYNPENPLMEKLNSLLSNRPSLGKQAIEDYGWTLFGQPIEWIGWQIEGTSKTYNYVDCGYLQIALEYGLVPLFLVLCIYAGLIYRTLKNSDYYLFFCIVFVLGLAVTEVRIINFPFNPLPVLLFSEIKTVPRLENLLERLQRKRKTAS